MSEERRFIHVANPDWVANELQNAATELELAIRRGEHPTFRLALIAKRREADERPWNWCSVCDVEVPVRHRHQNAVHCPSCLGRFVEVHEGTVANDRIQNDPAILYKAYYDQFSACWWEWSLQSLEASRLPDGALAYDVTPYELPTRTVVDGTRRVSRRERRLIARRSAGVPGRRGSKPVPTHVPKWEKEPFEPEYVRCLKVVKQELVTDSPFPREISHGAELVAHRRTQHGYAARICELCRCEARVLATVYIEHTAPHLETLIKQGVMRAAVRLGTYTMGRQLCFCKVKPLSR